MNFVRTRTNKLPHNSNPKNRVKIIELLFSQNLILLNICTSIILPHKCPGPAMLGAQVIDSGYTVNLATMLPSSGTIVK